MKKQLSIKPRKCDCGIDCNVQLIRKSCSIYLGRHFYGCQNWNNGGCQYFELVEEYPMDGFERFDGYILTPLVCHANINSNIYLGLVLDLWCIIFSFIDPEFYLKVCTKVCKKWRNLSFDKYWMKNCFKGNLWDHIEEKISWRNIFIFHYLDKFVGSFLFQWGNPQIILEINNRLNEEGKRHVLFRKECDTVYQLDELKVKIQIEKTIPQLIENFEMSFGNIDWSHERQSLMLVILNTPIECNIPRQFYVLYLKSSDLKKSISKHFNENKFTTCDSKYMTLKFYIMGLSKSQNKIPKKNYSEYTSVINKIVHYF